MAYGLKASSWNPLNMHVLYKCYKLCHTCRMDMWGYYVFDIRQGSGQRNGLDVRQKHTWG